MNCFVKKCINIKELRRPMLVKNIQKKYILLKKISKMYKNYGRNLKRILYQNLNLVKIIGSKKDILMDNKLIKINYIKHCIKHFQERK